MAWFFCRSRQGSLVLRMEDIDPARSRDAYARAIIDDLHWLGLDWDEGPDKEDIWGMKGPHAPYAQSARQHHYLEALQLLDQRHVLYPCFCTRKELRTLAGAPHIGDGGAPYPGTCRALSPSEQERRAAFGRTPALRLACPEGVIAFDDHIYGNYSSTLTACGGDFALRRSDGVIAYQLAVVVDDALMGINQVVRGRDILSSTPRQVALFDLLAQPAPKYAHIPLVCDEQGERLAKRHSSLTLRTLQDEGVAPEALTGYLLWKAGILPEAIPLHPRRLLEVVPVLHVPSWWRERDILLEDDPLSTLKALSKAGMR